MQDSIYIVFSATPYLLGKAIRTLAGETYNHVSIALDRELSQMYSFARRHYRLPFYGGFVRESRSRYCVKGKSTDICLCRIPVTQQQYETLANMLSSMYNSRLQYLYNHFSVLAALARRPIKVKDAYTCIEFCVKLLHTLGIDVDPKRYYSLGQLQHMLASYTVYTGPMSPSEEFDCDYYAPKPVANPVWVTVRDICKLFLRLGA